MIVPIYLLIVMAYLLYVRKVNIKHILAEAVPFIVLGLPLAIQQLVNMRIIPEFSFLFTDFYCTSRHLDRGELALSNVPDKLWSRTISLFALKDNYHEWFSIDKYGTIYYLSIPFLIIGISVVVVKTIKSIKHRVYDSCSLILMLLIVEYCIAIIVGAGHEANGIYCPLMMLTSLGIEQVTQFAKKKYILPVIFVLYLVLFGFFARWMYSYGEDGWTSTGRPEMTDFLVVDTHAALAAKEIKDKYGYMPIQMILNDKGDDWWASICLYYGISPYEYHEYSKDQNFLGDGYAIGVPDELDLSGGTAYLIEGELDHITKFLVSQGFSNEVVKNGGYSMVVKID